ncbi:uncharacterized protein LOC114296301 [Camellia sinensis]|uniref:uncharacterized protein LOC114296301 n=1 Tax=Camellia sinensis TaxID=4442 RepID=UPI0010363CAC|nr:uncharacterized protein LOC114296301 [Camellia sinensis]
MGNFMETCRDSQEVEMREHEKQENEENGGGFVKDDGGLETSAVRIKIVLTKEELEWLVFQLKDERRGNKRLEDVLEEIERGRGKVEGWKPSLESIMESPEVPEMDK